MMNKSELQSLLNSLISTWENEVVEFKQAGKDYDTNKIGEYFSALANEANLRNVERAWLVFGVDNASRKVVGSDYREAQERLHSLKFQISQGCEPSITFREIHELLTGQGLASCCSRFPPRLWVCQSPGKATITPAPVKA